MEPSIWAMSVVARSGVMEMPMEQMNSLFSSSIVRRRPCPLEERPVSTISCSSRKSLMISPTVPGRWSMRLVSSVRLMGPN